MDSTVIRFGFFILLLSIAGCTGGETAHEHDTYTCPMHPTVTADHPGKCPVCGMDLVRKSKPGQEVEMTRELSNLSRSTNEVVISGIKTIKPEYKSIPVTVYAPGVVTYDTRDIYTIAARVSGRLERVNLRYAYQPVTRGQAIAEIYSPELITAQRELLFLVENDGQNTSLIKNSKTKLELLGMSARQIADLIETRRARSTVSIYSPNSGYVVAAAQAPPTSRPIAVQQSSTAGAMEDGMSSSADAQMPQDPKGQSGSLVREGDYVTTGQTLFRIVSDRALRIELDLPAAYNGLITPGSKVQLRLDDGNIHAGTIDFIEPFLTDEKDFLKVRVYMDKTQGFRIGGLLNAALQLEGAENLWVPKESIVDLGIQKIVYLKTGDVLRPKKVLTGLSASGMTEIRSGLATSDEIAANAQYLVDSESFVKPLE